MTRCLLLIGLICLLGFFARAQQTGTARLAVCLHAVQGLNIKSEGNLSDGAQNKETRIRHSDKLEVLSVGKFVVKVSTLKGTQQGNITAGTVTSTGYNGTDRLISEEELLAANTDQSIISAGLQGTLAGSFDLSYHAKHLISDKQQYNTIPTVMYTLEAH